MSYPRSQVFHRNRSSGGTSAKESFLVTIQMALVPEKLLGNTPRIHGLKHHDHHVPSESCIFNFSLDPGQRVKLHPEQLGEIQLVV